VNFMQNCYIGVAHSGECQDIVNMFHQNIFTVWNCLHLMLFQMTMTAVKSAVCNSRSSTDTAPFLQQERKYFYSVELLASYVVSNDNDC
jgi:hypothetical protein